MALAIRVYDGIRVCACQVRHSQTRLKQTAWDLPNVFAITGIHYDRGVYCRTHGFGTIKSGNNMLAITQSLL
jgi:hypothetical protein